MSNENQLTESQLFTIEALNRIEEFVWPEGADGAEMRDHDPEAYFCSSSNPKYRKVWHTGVLHPNCTDSLITREQFDSVDGWVRARACGVMPNGNIEVDIKRYSEGAGFQSGSLAKFINWNDVKLWRYHKRANEKVIPEAVNQSIDQLINAWQKAKANADTSRAILQLAEKEESDAREAVYCALRAVGWGAK